MRRDYGELLPKTSRARTIYFDSRREPGVKAAERIGLVRMMRSASFRAFAEALAGRRLRAGWGLQVLRYGPGDYAGPHNDHHPENPDARRRLHRPASQPVHAGRGASVAGLQPRRPFQRDRLGRRAGDGDGLSPAVLALHDAAGRHARRRRAGCCWGRFSTATDATCRPVAVSCTYGTPSFPQRERRIPARPQRPARGGDGAAPPGRARRRAASRPAARRRGAGGLRLRGRRRAGACCRSCSAARTRSRSTASCSGRSANGRARAARISSTGSTVRRGTSVQRLAFVVVAKSPIAASARLRARARLAAPGAALDRRQHLRPRLLRRFDRARRRRCASSRSSPTARNGTCRSSTSSAATASTIRHFWGSELLYVPPEPGQEYRHNDLLDPLWNMFDVTPEGRGDFHPKRSS